MNETPIGDRLDQLLPLLRQANFLEGRGLGNEIGFYIFDYEPEHEPLVARHVARLQEQLREPPDPVTVLDANLYEIVLSLLERRGFLEKAIELEATQGSAALRRALSPLLRPEVLAAEVRARLAPEHRIVFLTGVGAVWPLARSHAILNNLHPILDRTPVVMFFPGRYDGHELRLFSTFKDDNYYRAFQLVPRGARPGTA